LYESPTNRAEHEAFTSEPWPIRGFIVNPIQPRRSASAPARLSGPNPQLPEEHLSGTVHQHRCAVAPITNLTVAKPCSGRSYRINSPP